jgi:hypothetical protein
MDRHVLAQRVTVPDYNGSQFPPVSEVLGRTADDRSSAEGIVSTDQQWATQVSMGADHATGTERHRTLQQREWPDLNVVGECGLGGDHCRGVDQRGH